jgi:hypothetical protein
MVLVAGAVHGCRTFVSDRLQRCGVGDEARADDRPHQRQALVGLREDTKRLANASPGFSAYEDSASPGNAVPASVRAQTFMWPAHPFGPPVDGAPRRIEPVVRDVMAVLVRRDGRTDAIQTLPPRCGATRSGEWEPRSRRLDRSPFGVLTSGFRDAGEVMLAYRVENR